jgi:hypothetical protein
VLGENMEFVSFIDTRKGKKLLKVFKSQRAANMFLKKNMDNILSKSGVDSIGSMSKKEWDTKEAKYAIEGFKSDAQRKAAFANGYEEKDKKNESVNEAAITYGIEYKSSKNDRKFKKASLTKTTHNPKIDKMMIKAISKDAKSLAKQDGWVDYRITKDGVPVKESVNEGISVSDERHFGKKGIIIMIDDNGKKVAAIFKDKKNADKFNRNKSSDIQKLLQLAKKTKYPKAIDESLNEAGKLAMGIAALTGTRGSAVQDFIDKNRINDKKLFKALKKANLQGRINFASALAGRPGNPNEKLTIKLFGESKKEVIAFRKKAKSETAFYDILDKIERKYGRGVFEKWLDKSLKDLKLNPKKYKTPADKQEALYQAKL